MKKLFTVLFCLACTTQIFYGQVAPSATTNAASSISCSGAILNGTINPNGADTFVYFEYGLTTAYGVTLKPYQILLDELSGASSVYRAIGNLLPNTTYHFRVGGYNGYTNEGTTGGTTVWGDDQSFTTSAAGLSTVYINSNTGNDFTGDGSSGNPYKTFFKGYPYVAIGGTINLTGTFTWTDADETGDIDVYGYLLLTDVTIQGQGADKTIIQAASSAGSAASRIFSIDGTCSITLKDLEMRYGMATSGGAIKSLSSNNENENLTIRNCYIHDNNGQETGGAIYLSKTTLDIINSTFAYNKAEAGGFGGALYVSNSSSATITNSTFYSNSATMYGGAIYFTSDGSSFVITNCTIANNSLTDNGGLGSGIEFDNGTLQIKNTIIANNTGGDASSSDFDFYYDGSDYKPILTDNGYNIVQYTNGTFSGTNSKTADQVVSLNLSSSLALNNATNGIYTLALTSGSLAIDAGDNFANGSVSIPNTDQRGAARNGTVDIGAYEFWDDAGSLPVELTSFAASVIDNKVKLSWQTATEVNNYGFDVERQMTNDGNSQSSFVNSKWEKVGFVSGAGNSNSPKSYSFEDKNPPAGKIQYRLKQIDNDGKYQYSSIVETEFNKPEEFKLAQNYPNPFNPTTKVEFSIPSDNNVEIKAYNVLGMEVATLLNEQRQAGTHSIEFNASNLSSGLYFYKIVSGKYSEIKKMILLR